MTTKAIPWPALGAATHYDVQHAVNWMRRKLADETPRQGLTRDMAAAYQDAHDLSADLWRDLYKTAELAVRLWLNSREAS